MKPSSNRNRHSVWLLVMMLCLLLVSELCQAQIAENDSTEIIEVSNPKLPFFQTLYARCSPVTVYTGPGFMKDRISQNFEIGRTFGMMDCGLAFGRNALRRDSSGNGTHFLEAKFSMDIAQYGIFSNEMTIGAGGVFNSKNYLMLELSYTIFAQFWKNFGMGIVTGYYDFSGNQTGFNRNTFGIFCRYGLIHSDGGLFNLIGRISRTHYKGGKPIRRK